MSYTYLLDLYDALDNRIRDISIELQETPTSPERCSYQQGRLDTLAAFKMFLRENYHQKLPRRIQRFIDAS